MDELKKIFKEGREHHAYLIEGSIDTVLSDLEGFFQSIGFSINNNPDYIKRTSENFSINEVREVIERDTRGKLGEKKIFVLGGVSFTREAQNGLLKILEEPQKGSYFFIITTRSFALLPTLKSRLYQINYTQSDNTEEKDAKKFLDMSVPERLKHIQKFTEENDRDGAYTFLRALEKVSNEKIKGEEKYISLSEIIKMADYIKDTSSSVKMILEHISVFI